MPESSQLELFSARRLSVEGEPTYSVSEINELVQAVLHEQFPRQVWVRGEIKGYDLRKHRQWVSFKFVEKHTDSDDVLAEVTAIVSPEDRKTIEAILQRAENGFQLQDGIEVRFKVEVDLWVKAGLYQLRVRSIDPTYTLGRLAQNRKRILELLTQHGLINRNKRLILPLVPLRIGLIAAKGSAGLTDFVTHLAQSGFAFAVTFVDSAMQGSQVESEVSRALRALNRAGVVDVIVITRGGGGATDLSWFDRFGLAEAIATSRVPVLTGLGHTHDTSVADLVAYANLKTPTDAAQFLIDRVAAFLDALDEVARQLGGHVDTLLSHAQAWLVDCQRDIARRSEGLVAVERRFLTSCVPRISLERVRQLLDRELGRVRERGARLGDRTAWLIQREHDRLLQHRRAYTFPRVSRALLRGQLQLQAVDDRVAMLDPLKTLKRGFSISRNAKGKVVTTVADVGVDEPLMTEVTNGSIRSHVRSVEPHHKEERGGRRKDQEF